MVITKNCETGYVINYTFIMSRSCSVEKHDWNIETPIALFNIKHCSSKKFIECKSEHFALYVLNH